MLAIIEEMVKPGEKRKKASAKRPDINLKITYQGT